MHKALQKKYNAQNQDELDTPSGSYPKNTNDYSENQDHSSKLNGTTSQPLDGTLKGSNNTYIPSYKSSKSLDEIMNHLEQYNCPKSGIRLTSDCFPDTRSAFKASKIPFAAVVQPYASVYPSESFPTVSYRANQEIVRCSECRAYVNPFTVFLENGSKYRCNLCNTLNQVPEYYIASLDSKGERVDKDQRVELCCGIYDIKAGTDYMSRPPMPPTFVFLIDVSQESVQTGMLDLAIRVIHSVIDNELFPGKSRAQIGIIAYDSALHYFIINPKLKNPQIVTVANPKDFDGAPFPDEIILNIADSKSVILTAIDCISTMFSNTKDRGSCLLAALESVTKGIKHIGGRLFVLQAASNLTAEIGLHLPAPIQALDKKALYIPSGPVPSSVSAEMSHNFISTTFFIFSDAYKNVITVAEFARYTAGEVFYYSSGNERERKFYNEFKNVIIKDTVWEAVFRLRVSSGWKIVNRYGNFGIKSGDLLSVPCIDEYKSIIYEFELDEELPRAPIFYIQTALLYTNTHGERRIRVINYGVPLEKMKNVFLKADAQAISFTLFRKALAKLYNTQDPPVVRNYLMQESGDIIKEMCRVCGITKQGTYIATQPLTILGMLKNCILSPNGVAPTEEMDVRNALRIRLNSTSLDDAMLLFTPYLFSLHTMVDEGSGIYDEEGGFIFPQLLSLTSANLSKDGLYLVDDGLELYMFVGSEINKEILNNLFGITDLSVVSKLVEDHMYSNSKDPLVERIYNLITELRSRKTERYAYLNIIKEGEKSAAEYEFYLKLVEDKVIHPHTLSMSYIEFVNRLFLNQQ